MELLHERTIQSSHTSDLVDKTALLCFEFMRVSHHAFRSKVVSRLLMCGRLQISVFKVLFVTFLGYVEEKISKPEAFK